ncbi:kinase-like protein [Corynespora cassiicola Philippines]|uniref:non-specific serine/threonine protein kinase n=1 Tax=Corynespora cassiicola Philippines TaxID=1448308 RepID=A0A2T2N0Z4_CORCC|nr:kinase-like protein [Corynespora cassiicola Philippines]PSN59285.1 kinase-like protein [Corynespora cassiicola Philippines]
MAKRSFTCQIDAEPLYRYGAGGYHPIHLGDILGDGRYEVIHKLGWGASSTVWAARDRESNQNVAVKVNIAATNSAIRELQLLREIATDDTRGHSPSYLIQWLDDFEINGPNGKHVCIVTELLGPSIADLFDMHGIKDCRLPAKWAKNTAKQLLTALNHLHRKEIGHGDVHTRNIVIKDQGWDHLSEAELLSHLGKPDTAEVLPSDHGSVGLSLPKYIVRPGSFHATTSCLGVPEIRLIDFGEAFKKDNKPKTLHTPLALRAPEIIFGDVWDYRVDLWSAGCTIFEIITGQPPFDSVMVTEDILIGQMVDEIGSLPDRWAARWQARNSGEDEKYSLEEWLMELYFDEEKEAEFTQEQLQLWAKALRLLMRFEPTERVSAADILHERCLN